jgi:uncharacterized protein YjbI with pentapeptide repeats
LDKTIFANAKLDGARFNGTDLSKSDITQKQLDLANSDKDTIPPPNTTLSNEALAQKDFRCDK